MEVALYAASCTFPPLSKSIVIFYYTCCNTPNEECNEFTDSFLRYCAGATHLLSKKRRSGANLLATLCPISPGRDLNLKTSRVRNECVTARLPGQYQTEMVTLNCLIQGRGNVAKVWIEPMKIRVRVLAGVRNETIYTG